MMRTMLLSAAAVGALGIAAWQFGLPFVADAAADGLGRGGYELVTTEGETFTQASLRGKPTAVFFGFTYCPDVCPTTMGEIAAWQEDLVPEGEDLRTFFVTVDPERDTIEHLEIYVSWVPGVVGVTGDPEEIDEAIDAFKAYAAKVPLDDGGYTMEHTANVLLFDAEGRFVHSIGYGEAPERVAEKFAALYAS